MQVVRGGTSKPTMIFYLNHRRVCRRHCLCATPSRRSRDTSIPSGLIVGARAGLKTGVVSSSSSSPPSSLVIETSFTICTASGGLSTMTANSRVPIVFAGTVPTKKLQLVPAGLPSGQDHPGVLRAAWKVVWSGTVSSTTTFVAGAPPELM